MWAQSMIEHGLLSGAVSGIGAVHARVSAALDDGPTRTGVIAIAIVMAFWLLRRR